MAIRGITFSKQTVSSNDDAHIYRILLCGRKGKTKGCEMTFDVDNVYIATGYFFAANRLIEISSTEIVTSPIVASGVMYCRLVFEIDLTKTNTNTEFLQGTFKILSDGTNYPALTQEDLEEGGTLYQLPFAKFQKSPSGIANFVSELETIGFAEKTKYLYVSPSGNDAIGDGSEGNPFATIQKAIDSMPRNLNGNNAIIFVAAGTYNEYVEIADFTHGGVTIANQSSGNVTINGDLSVSDCHSVQLSGFGTLTINGRAYISNTTSFFNSANNTVVNDTIYAEGVRIINSNVVFNSNLSAKSLSYGTGVLADNGANAFIENITIQTGTGTGIKADAGGQIAYNTLTNNATTKTITARGGRIYSGAQTSIPKY